jgi:hypothetical protein
MLDVEPYDRCMSNSFTYRVHAGRRLLFAACVIVSSQCEPQFAARTQGSCSCIPEKWAVLKIECNPRLPVQVSMSV